MEWANSALHDLTREKRRDSRCWVCALVCLLAAKCLVEVENKIGDVSAYQAVGMYGILRQNERPDAGEPTEIHVNINASVSIDDLLDKLGHRLIEVNKQRRLFTL